MDRNRDRGNEAEARDANDNDAARMNRDREEKNYSGKNPADCRCHFVVSIRVFPRQPNGILKIYQGGNRSDVKDKGSEHVFRAVWRADVWKQVRT